MSDTVESRGHQLEQAQAKFDAELRHATVLGKHTGLVAAVLRHHAPYFSGFSLWPICNGCDGASGDFEADWPCSTYELIENAVDA